MARIIALGGNRHQDAYLTGIGDLLAALAEEGFLIQIQPRFFRYLSDAGVVIPKEASAADEPSPQCVAALSIGGDGTFLRAAQWVADRGIPILGVNTGHLGFLAHCSLDEPRGLARSLASGSYSSSRRMLLRVEGEGIPGHVWPFALNEVAILKEDTSSMINVDTWIDGYFLAGYLADGLIISTPTGSTGYNLSVGGPIVQPSLDCRVISPIAPHSLTMRPLVVDAVSMIEATTTSRSLTYRVSLDGRSFVMRCGTTVRICRAPFDIGVLELPEENFASTLRHKLHWGVR